MDRLTADDYHRAALEILGEDGSEALTIASLCERLAVTKGSFYHHFGSWPGFVADLVGSWSTASADQLALAVRAQPDPTLRFAAFVDTAVALPHAAEAALRAWGRSNPEVAEAVAGVDKRREKQLTDTIAGLGVARAQAKSLARLAVTVLIGAQLRERTVDVRRLRAAFAEVTRLVTSDANGG